MTRTAYQLRDFLDAEVTKASTDPSRLVHARAMSMLCSKICYTAVIQARYHRNMGYTHPIAFLEEPRAAAPTIKLPKIK